MSSRSKKKQQIAWMPFEQDTVTKADLGDPEAELWINNRYTVIKRYMGDGEFGPLYHLSIRRNDRGVARDWRDFQRIKNELVGPEAEGVELYPAESRLVDTANQYHLWVLEKARMPFGWNQRLVTDAGSQLCPDAVQRPFEDGQTKLTSPEEVQRMVEQRAAAGKR